MKTLENKKDGTPRICIKCLKRKCDRCHHCSICNNCVLMMDHHCPWINNCIGFYNYKYFYLLINYCMLSLLLVNLTYWETLKSVINQNQISALGLTWISVVFLLSIVMGFILILFWGFHLRLTLTNYTTLEYCEKKREHQSTWNTSPFDTGSAIGNLQVKIGYDKFFFLPTTPSLKSNGTTFPILHQFETQHLQVDDEDMIGDEIRPRNQNAQPVDNSRKMKIN